MSNKFTTEQLEFLQSLPLDIKIKKTQLRIREWYEYWEGDVYVAFSGGKDSTVLLDIARKMYPNIEAVYCDTGMEYPEIKEFVKSHDNVTIIRPKYTFKQILTKFGYPVISKEVARTIEHGRKFINDNITKTIDWVPYQLDLLTKWVSDNIIPMPAQALNDPRYGLPEEPIPLRGSGITYNVASLLGLLRKDNYLMWKMKRNERSQYNRAKWRHLLNFNFKISDRCCEYMKKSPSHRYSTMTGKQPIIGTMADEGALRLKTWLKYGCNTFKGTKSSKPLSFWTEQDIYQYIVENDLTIASVYGKIIKDDKGEYHTTGCDRTGCVFCMFGLQMENEPNRFQRLKQTHPKLWDYCMRGGEVSDTGWWQPSKDGLGMAYVLERLRLKGE